LRSLFLLFPRPRCSLFLPLRTPGSVTRSSHAFFPKFNHCFYFQSFLWQNFCFIRPGLFGRIGRRFRIFCRICDRRSFFRPPCALSSRSDRERSLRIFPFLLKSRTCTVFPPPLGQFSRSHTFFFSFSLSIHLLP